MPIPIECVKTKDFSMRFFRFGSGKKTMVILPGLSVKSVMQSALPISAQYQIFAKEYTVYVFERREAVPPVYPLAQMAEDTACAMQALQLKDTYLFGASQGGMMAMHITATHPKLVKKLALGSTAAKVDDRRGSTILEWISLAEQKEPVALYESFCRNIYPLDFYEKYKELFRAAAQTVSDEELERFIIMARSIETLDLSDALEAIRCPVLVIGSEDDAVLGSAPTLEIYHALQPHTPVQYYLYKDRGHDAYDTAPDYQERLYRFFEE
ncbi:MAG: alpha/beta hydrolase [Clostridia bacterium]|nr:alpha/beta hydrolase [Clostridia bacterium]